MRTLLAICRWLYWTWPFRKRWMLIDGHWIPQQPIILDLTTEEWKRNPQQCIDIGLEAGRIKERTNKISARGTNREVG